MNTHKKSFAKQSSFKSWKWLPESVKKQAEANRDGVINPHNYNCHQFYTDNFDALQTLRINQSRP